MDGSFRFTKSATSMMSFLRFTVLVILLMEERLCRGQSTDRFISTNCSEEILLPAASPENLVLVNVRFDNDTVYSNCSWIIPAPKEDDLRYGNTLFMDVDNVPDPLCQEGDIRVYDVLDSKGTVSNSGVSMCTSERRRAEASFNGRHGLPTLVTLTLQTVTQSNFSIFGYLSVDWASPGCPRDFVRFNATAQEQSIRVGFKALSTILPDGLSCFWEIVSPDQGLVTIKMSDGNYGTDCVSTPNYLLTRDEKDSDDPVSYVLCKNGINVHHTSLTGAVFLELHTADSGDQSPTFTITYSAQAVCSPNLALQASLSEAGVFKGASEPGSSETCSWTISTVLSTQVVMLTKLDNREFLQDCSGEDFLSVGEEERKVSLCDNSTFPVWSAGKSLRISLHHQPGKSRRDFLVTFTEVDQVGACQGHSQTYRPETTEWVSTGSFYRINSSLPYIGSSCRWNFNSSSDEHKLQVRVSIYEGLSSKRHDCSVWRGRFVAHTTEDKTTTTDNLATSCSLDIYTVQLMFTTTAKSLTLEYPVGRITPETSFAVGYRLSNGSCMMAMSWAVVVVLQLLLMGTLNC